MSRIGKKNITIPSTAKVSIDGSQITVSGPKGTLKRELHPLISVTSDGNLLSVIRANDSKLSRSLHGLTRTLIDNMVVGVTTGFRKELKVTGVGFKVDEKGKQLALSVGYSHVVDFDIPDGIVAKLDKQKGIIIILEGYDKELLGLTAAKLRAVRPPEPYKGKGIQYVDEVIIRKAGKTTAKKK